MAPSSPPQRTCIACRRKTDQARFLRIAKDRSGNIAVLDIGPSFSRSAYICPDQQCIDSAVSKGRLGRALRIPSGEFDPSTIINDLQCKLKRKKAI